MMIRMEKAPTILRGIHEYENMLRSVSVPIAIMFVT